MPVYWTRHPDGDRYEPTLSKDDTWKIVGNWILCAVVEIAFVAWVLS